VKPLLHSGREYSPRRGNDDVVLLAHGGGGLLSQELIRRVFVRLFTNPALDALEDASNIPLADAHGYLRGQPVMTTDSYVVQPIFFPGGDIGKLSICGTVNDLAMRGAVPLYLTAGFVLEEGLPIADLERVVASMATAAHEAGVQIVAGDTKVVEQGSADKLFINTAGIGLVPEGVSISASGARPGDVVLVSGAVGDHGIAILTQREGLRFDSPLRSDCAPLNGLVAAMLAVCPEGTRERCPVHVLRDPTRGGLATTLNELATQSAVGIEIDETAVPVHEAVRAASDLLGLDPLYVANEGKLIAIVAPEDAEAVLEAMRAHPLGSEAAIIGRVLSERPGRVVLRTALGTRRLLDVLAGEQLPRIC
jgi:hydrogenase expression/formation protein HypE